MSNPGSDLAEALLEALPAWLESRLGQLGVDPADHDQVVAEALAEAGEGLEALLAGSYESQREVPLEVVRRALRRVTASLAEAGVPAPRRDDDQERVAPDDPYGLAPASAAELGDDALAASLAWGSAKAAQMARPLLLVVSSNLLDGTRLESAATDAGYRAEIAAEPTPSVRPVVAFVDLEADRADAAISLLASQGVRVIAYGPHVDDIALVRARTLGATDAEPRSRFFRDPTRYLPPLV